MLQMDDLPVGTEVVLPSGSIAIIRKYLAGESKYDHFTRVICQYKGGTKYDYVTLQPHLVIAASNVQRAMDSVAE